MMTNFSAPEFIAIIGSLFVVLTALNLAARLQRNLRQSRNSHLPSSSQGNASKKTPQIRVLTVKKQESEEKLVDVS